MLFNYIFKEKTSVSSAELPLLTLISLETWVLIKLQGIDSVQFLHNQFTCDIKNLNKYQYSFSTHCNVHGRMITNMYVFYFNNQEIAYIEPKSVSNKQIMTMLKYAKFSDVIITPKYNAAIIGVVGLHARKFLNIFFKKLPDQTNTVIYYQSIIIIRFNLPTERFLLIITSMSLLTTLINGASFFSAQYNNHNQWIALDIEAGYPYIGFKTSELFFPQSVNLDILNGINFNKGCFLGQEILARIQYRKLNKHTLYHLIGKSHQKQDYFKLPMSGDQIEAQMNNNWKAVGIILQSCRIKNNYIWIQAVLNKLILKTYHLRVKNTKFKISII